MLEQVTSKNILWIKMLRTIRCVILVCDENPGLTGLNHFSNDFLKWDKNKKKLVIKKRI